jgi:CRP/FNR family cyclic AMP-dependent transcriptional regulator
MRTSEHHTMPIFNTQVFLDSAGIGRKIVEYRRGEAVFSQGDACQHVMYVQKGGVKLSVRSKTGREAIVAMLGPGGFFGEGCLVGQRTRAGNATAVTPTTILQIDKRSMLRVLQRDRAMSHRFITHMLTTNVRIEEDLIDQLFSSSEKRLARTLLLLAGYGHEGEPHRIIPKISQTTLADMSGTTRAHVTGLLRKFRKRGFIQGNGRFTIDGSLLTVVLRD